MKAYKKLLSEIHRKRNFLCIGLDSDIDRIPSHFKSESNPILAFNKKIIEATAQYCVAYKINFAFYESQGRLGWEALEATLALIPDTHFTIADAKRGDIGNTARHYAKAVFETLSFDAVTLSPYMGEDSIEPFLEYKDKVVILLALTSNTGSADFQITKLSSGRHLFEEVIRTSSEWAGADQMMYVIGATHPKQLASIRARIPHHFFLVPGIGTQGGKLEEVCTYAINEDVGLLINASRSILFAGSGPEFAEKAAASAAGIAYEMSEILAEINMDVD